MRRIRAIMTGLAVAGIAGCGVQEAPDTAGAVDLDRLRQRVAALEEKNAVLTTEMAALQVRENDALEQQVMAAVDRRVEDLIAHEIAASIDARIGTEADVEAIFQEAVQDGVSALEAQRQAERAEQRKRWQEDMAQRRAEWEQQRMDRMANELGLDESQKEQMAAVSTEMRQVMADTFRAMAQQEGGINPASIRTAMDDIRTHQEAAVGKFLTPDQMTRYRERQNTMFGAFGNILDAFTPRPESAPAAGGVN